MAESKPVKSSTPKAASAPKKVAAPKKAAAPKKVPAKKAPAAKKASTKKTKPSAEALYKMTEVAAYYIALNDSFKGNPSDYWISAEAQITALYK